MSSVTMGPGNTFEYRTGFTLLEMIVSIGIFSVLVVAAIGVTIGVSNAQLKAANIQASQDNIRYSVELMTKEMRTGSQYALLEICGVRLGEAISFSTSGGVRRIYYHDHARMTIMRLGDSTDCGVATQLLSEEVGVVNLRFRIGGGAPGAQDGQPWVSVALSVRSQGPKEALESQMDLQTMVVQRYRDQ